MAITDANFDVHSTGSWDDDGAEEDVRNAWPGVDMGFQIDVDAILEPLTGAFPELEDYIGRCCDAFAVTVDTQANVTLSANLSPAPSQGGGFPWSDTVVDLGDVGVLVVDQEGQPWTGTVVLPDVLSTHLAPIGRSGALKR